MEEAESITNKRLDIWNQYHDAFNQLELAGKLRRPIISEVCQHNAHMYYILMDSLEQRTDLIAKLKEQRISTVFHYVPLHSSPAGLKYGRVHGEMIHTEDIADRLLRLPVWIGLTAFDLTRVIDAISSAISKKNNSI